MTSTTAPPAIVSVFGVPCTRMIGELWIGHLGQLVFCAERKQKLEPRPWRVSIGTAGETLAIGTGVDLLSASHDCEERLRQRGEMIAEARGAIELGRSDLFQRYGFHEPAAR